MKGNLTKGILKKGKKIVTLALSMAMVVSSINVVPVNAEPDSTIPDVEIGIAAPAAGNEANYEMKKIGNESDTDTYKVSENYSTWYVKKDESKETTFGTFETDDNWIELDDDEKFENNKTYCIDVKLVSSDFERFMFSDDETKYTCNGNGKLINFSVNEKCTIAYLVFEFKCKDALKNVDLKIEKPVEGKTPADTKVSEIETTPENALNCELLASKIDLSGVWQRFDEEKLDWVDVKSDEEFEGRKPYRIKKAFVPSIIELLENDFIDLANYDVVNNLSDSKSDIISINGINMSDQENDLYDFGYSIGKIKKVQFFVSLPVPGTSVSEMTVEIVGDDKNKIEFFSIPTLDINELQWNKMVGDSWVAMNSDEKFVEDENYKVEVNFANKENYVTAKDTEYYINGHKVNKSNYGVSYVFTSKALGSELKFDIDKPVVGQKANQVIKINSTPENAIKEEFRVIDTTGTWEESEDGENWVKMTSDTFENGKYYRTGALNAWFDKRDELFLEGILFFDDTVISGFLSNEEGYKELINGIDAQSEEGKNLLKKEETEAGFSSYICFGLLKEEESVVSPETGKTNTGDSKTGDSKTDDSKTDAPKVGATIKDSDYIYKVTKAGSKDGKAIGEVSVTGLNKKSLKKVKIATKVKIDGVTYKVTSIGAKAFKAGLQDQRGLTIPSRSCRSSGRRTRRPLFSCSAQDHRRQHGADGPEVHRILHRPRCSLSPCRQRQFG